MSDLMVGTIDLDQCACLRMRIEWLFLMMEARGVKTAIPSSNGTATGIPSIGAGLTSQQSHLTQGEKEAECKQCVLVSLTCCF